MVIHLLLPTPAIAIPRFACRRSTFHNNAFQQPQGSRNIAEVTCKKCLAIAEKTAVRKARHAAESAEVTRFLKGR